MATSKIIEPARSGLRITSASPDQPANDRSRAIVKGLTIFLSLFCALFALLWLNHSSTTPALSPHTAATPSSSGLADCAGGDPARVTVFRAESANELVAELKKNRLWDIKAGSSIAPLLVANYPSDLETLSTQEKKKAFLHSLLPAALMVNAEISKERETLLVILDKISLPASTIIFSARHKDWQQYVDQDEIAFLKGLSKKYRTKRAASLLRRVNTIPVSLILAQGALESSWGTSRFTKEGNSLFGLWTWRENGIVPLNREEGKNHRIEAYDSILASLRKYTLTLNRLDAYSDFRTIRTGSSDPYELVDGLQLYSERGVDYVNDIKRVISSNRLTDFDEVQFPEILVTMLPPAFSQYPKESFAQL